MSNSIRICSWNINGIRSINQPLIDVLESLKSDIICLQETKATKDLSSEFCMISGYNSYFSNSLHKLGYSGVAIFCKEPLRPVESYHSMTDIINCFKSSNHPQIQIYDPLDFLAIKLHISRSEARAVDIEGRIVVVKFPSSVFENCYENKKDIKPLVILSVYVPRLNIEQDDRLRFKHNFQFALQLCLEMLLYENNVVVAGDFNTIHRDIDHCAPSELQICELSICSRRWFNQLLICEQRDETLNVEATFGKLVDIFRLVHPHRQSAFTCWSTRTGARHTNHGVRLDYILFDSSLIEQFRSTGAIMDSDLMPFIQGSDHCPIWSYLPYKFNPNFVITYPYSPGCSYFWPQCQTKQTQLHFPVISCSYHNQSPGSSELVMTSPRQSKKHETDLRKTSAKESIWRQTKINFISKSIRCQNGNELSKAESNSRFTEPTNKTEKTQQVIDFWHRLLTGPKAPPLCHGHKEPCIMKTVKQQKTPRGNTRGRQFWICARPQGAQDNPNFRCNTFIWNDKST